MKINFYDLFECIIGILYFVFIIVLVCTIVLRLDDDLEKHGADAPCFSI